MILDRYGRSPCRRGNVFVRVAACGFHGPESAYANNVPIEAREADMPNARRKYAGFAILAAWAAASSIAAAQSSYTMAPPPEHAKHWPVVKEGKSADDTAVQLRSEFKDKYPAWDQPIRVHPAATVIYAELP